MANSNSRRERKRLESEINIAKNQIAERQKEIDTVAFTNLQLIQDRELLLSVYDPESYEHMKNKRAAYRQITLEQERKTEQLNKILLCIGIGVVVAVVLFVALYVLFAMG